MSGKNIYLIIKKSSGKVLLALSGLLFSPAVFAAEGPPAAPSINNPFALTLVIIMLVLLLAIVILANVVIGIAGLRYEKEKKEKKSNKAGITAAMLAGLVLLNSSLYAQDAASGSAATQASSSIGGLSTTAFWAMISVIGIELAVLFTFLFFLRSFLAKEKAKALAEEGAVVYKPKKKVSSWWNRFNKFKPIEQEADIDLGHDYDGIRELDNRLPPWWLYGFYITILFAVVYLWRYHVAHSAPLSKEELRIEMARAEEQKADYLKKAASLVDENTVKLLTDASDIAEGKKIFTNPAFCVACHKADGGGLVGPNLTDDYWIHGGSISDIFKTIKYGWPEKGMKSWKDDLSPLQIAQVASYIKSLHGTNPPQAKAPEGSLYSEPGTTDSSRTNTKSDSTSVVVHQ